MQIGVEELIVTREERVISDIKDPFLFVDLLDDSRWYLEVWNEPGFDGNRIS